MKKRLVSLLLAACMALTLVACGGDTAPAGDEGGSDDAAAELTATQKIIQEAQGMTLEELAQKAIEESNGKMFYGVGNSSRGKSALPLFIEYLQTIDPNYTLEFEWQHRGSKCWPLAGRRSSARPPSLPSSTPSSTSSAGWPWHSSGCRCSISAPGSVEIFGKIYSFLLPLLLTAQMPAGTMVVADISHFRALPISEGA